MATIAKSPFVEIIRIAVMLSESVRMNMFIVN
jgi:hypothetical protein